MRKRLHLLPPLLCVAALLVLAGCLLGYEDEYLWKVQELNLHLHTPLFFRQQMVVAGGLLTWLGTWFTEFFYHPVLGVAWLCAWWALLVVLAARAFRLPLKWWVVLLVPVALLVLSCVTLGYWIYYLKLRGVFFVASIGLSVVCAEVWAFRLLPERFFVRPLFVVAATALLYPLLGFYALLGAVLMAIMAWTARPANTQQTAPRRRSLGAPLLASAAALLALVVVPLLYYRFVFYQTSLENIWYTALPLFRIEQEYPAFYLPYALLAIFFVAMAASYGRWPGGSVKRPLVWGLSQLAVLIVLAVGVQHFWFRDYNFHKELRMQRLMEHEDWQGILTEAAQADDEPTRAIVLMKNLALSRLGRQGDEMYHYRTGAKASASPLPVNMTQVVGRSIYFYYGLPNFCYRWCLEDGVEYGWRAEYLKQMTRCAIANGEDRVARKYIGLLKRTRYFAEWAEQQEKLLGHPEALAQNDSYAPVLHLMDFDDRLNSDQAVVEQFLMYHFVYDHSTDSLFLEQQAMAALWMKDIQLFWPAFFRYAESRGSQVMPIHLQEAAYLYGHLENQIDISRMPFDESVKRNYDGFMQLAQRCRGMSEEQMKEVFFPQYGQTFYYEYFLIRNQKLY